MNEISYFDIDKWQSFCENLQKEVTSRSGCNYELFAETFSFEINIKLELLPIEIHQVAIQIAHDYGYTSENGLAEQADNSREQGYCIHHFETDCCSLGCGSI